MSVFKIDYRIAELRLSSPFTISRGTKESVRNVIVELSSEGITGYGEAAPNKRYEEDAETVISFLKGLEDDFFDIPENPDAVAQKIALVRPKVQAAAAALEMAWLDWWGKSKGEPLWRLWDAPSNLSPPTSYTIGIDRLEVIREKVKTAEAFPILKVKLGTDSDRDIIRAIREVTDKPIRVDANEGWHSVDEARKQIAFLREQNVELIEQPMPSSQKEDLEQLCKWSPLPIVADESFEGDEDLDEIARQFDGINIKLMKIGSLVKARNVIAQARKRGLQVMVGCMIESSLAISAASLIGTWADYVDLDGNLLIRNDPFSGLRHTARKEVKLSDRPGLGVRPQN